VAELTLPTPGAPNFLLQSNSPPIIAQLLPRVVFEGQLLALQIEATDPDPMQLLHFDLLPGVSTDAVLNSLTGWFSWRPAAEHVSRTYVFSFEVSDNGEPPLSSLASLEVTVVPLPKVTAVRTDSGSCSLSFVTIPGKTYRLDYTESLLTPDWRPLSEQYLAQADELTITDDTFSAGQRFYRITVLE
jgi:hypothetical protein